jgi:hypothetical protein
MSLVRLSVKKAAYADLSRAAYRKSGVSPGERFERRASPAGTAENTQDAILGYIYLRNGLFAIASSQPRPTSWATFSRPYGTQLGEGYSHADSLARTHPITASSLLVTAGTLCAPDRRRAHEPLRRPRPRPAGAPPPILPGKRSPHGEPRHAVPGWRGTPAYRR